ncbi:MAG: hypothetical protein QXP42_06075 [Candidatus Micrarchaeia archaeon]
MDLIDIVEEKKGWLALVIPALIYLSFYNRNDPLIITTLFSYVVGIAFLTIELEKIKKEISRNKDRLKDDIRVLQFVFSKKSVLASGMLLLICCLVTLWYLYQRIYEFWAYAFFISLILAFVYAVIMAVVKVGVRNIKKIVDNSNNNQ